MEIKDSNIEDTTMGKKRKMSDLDYIKVESSA